MNLLFYYCENKRSNSLETLLIELNKRVSKLTVLTTCEKGDLHLFLEKEGIETFATNSTSRFLNFFYLIYFCWKNKIEVVHSHLQPVNIISVFVNFFIKSRVIIFRHHFQFIQKSDFSEKINSTEILFDKLINLLATKIVVPSSGVYNGMIEFEKINKKNLQVLPYIYRFEKYDSPNVETANKIKADFPCSLRLIMVSRLVKLKQHHVVFPVINELVSKGFDIKLMVLDEGPEKERLHHWIKENKMEQNIIMLGFVTNFIDYMDASDMLIQPSLSDASNSAVKEMGMLEKIVAVTENVGDYSDFITHNKNGFLLPKKNTGDYLLNLVEKVYQNKNDYYSLGKTLKQDILNKFDVKFQASTIDSYLKL